MTDCRLYLVTPPALEPAAFAPQLAAALDGGDVACVQLRLKDADDDAVRRACDLLRPIAQARDVAFIVNDRPDLAAACGCDGAHVGQQDMSYAEARRLVGADAIVGVTCHDSRHLAMVAAEAGADYVAFGAFYPTTTKPSHYRPVPDLLQWWSELFEVPCVAIGGITPDNCGPLVAAGADFIAVVTGVWNHPDGPAAAVAAYNLAITRAG
ncbi:MAG: thiamine phosphate synthase [Azospirillum sp.]|nr:thiamine phosphate synthase [Azospirillum sp.]